MFVFGDIVRIHDGGIVVGNVFKIFFGILTYRIRIGHIGVGYENLLDA